MKSPILGSAYVARSVNAADNRMVNLYPEAVPEGGKERGFLNRCPGLIIAGRVGTGPIRGLYYYKNNAYIVSGTKLYAYNSSTNTAVDKGTIAGNDPVSIADNGTQMFIAANPKGYIYDNTTATLTEITDPDFPGSSTVQYLDGYFVFCEPNSQKLWSTALLDGTSIDALDFASAEGSPDNIVTILASYRELWVFGDNSTEVWYFDGGTNFPFSRIQGAYIEIGCIAPRSVAKADNSVFWLGYDARGNSIVYKSTNYSPQRVSTHAVEYAMQSYGNNVSDAVAYTYQQDGHTFYVINFPSADKTWAYDVATNAWHERASFLNGVLVRHRVNCHSNFGGYNYVGDYQTGDVYYYSLDTFKDNDQLSRWIRSWRAIPTGENNLKRSAQHSLQVDIEVGATMLNTGQGSDPVIDLRWSDDGGHTWSNYHSKSIGKIGETSKRVIWRRLGMTDKLRDRVYEISGTDPVKICIMGAELFVTPTAS